MIMFELNCRYDTRKSFYGKAKVVEQENGDLLLYSYDTLVARVKDGKFEVNSNVWSCYLYSNTTLRHIKEFFKQFFKYQDITKNDLQKLEINF